MPTDRQHSDSEHGASILPFPTISSAERSDDDGAVEDHEELRTVLGDVLRTERLDQNRTLADVAGDAHVSLAYLSEVERGLKDVSSELLGAIIGSLDVPLATVLERCIERLPVTGTQRGLDARLLAA